MLKKRKLFGHQSLGFQEIKYTCTVKFLDDSDPLTANYDKHTSGQELINYVCQSLNLEEKDYFGLRYTDEDKTRFWIDPNKSAYKQLKNVESLTLCFRVKFYPSDPSKIKEDITRYFIYLQLQRDLKHCRLICTAEETAILSAYSLQEHFGDYVEDFDYSQFLDQILPKHSPKNIKLTIEKYKELGGYSESKAEENFINFASKLYTYGIDPHHVKDRSGNWTYIGIKHSGFLSFQGTVEKTLHPWSTISRFDFDGKNFCVYTNINGKPKKLESFKCLNANICKNLWKTAVEQQFFYTLNNCKDATKIKGNQGLFRRSSSFRFLGSCEKDIWRSTSSLSRPQPSVSRSTSFARQQNSLNSTLPKGFKLNEDFTNETTDQSIIEQVDGSEENSDEDHIDLPVINDIANEFKMPDNCMESIQEVVESEILEAILDEEIHEDKSEENIQLKHNENEISLPLQKVCNGNSSPLKILEGKSPIANYQKSLNKSYAFIATKSVLLLALCLIIFILLIELINNTEFFIDVRRNYNYVEFVKGFYWPVKNAAHKLKFW